MLGFYRRRLSRSGSYRGKHNPKRCVWPMDHQDRRKYWALIGLLILLGGLFVLRGPARAVSGGSDLIHLYVAAALFVEGGDPYSGDACVDRAKQAGYPKPEHVADGSLYPLPTLAALAPLGLLSWDAARLVWLVVNLAACGVLVWAVAEWLSVKDPRLRWMAALLLVIAWGPVATALSLGQLSLFVVACICAGLVLLQRQHAIAAGVLIGLACVVKPQLGLGFLLLILLMRAWRASAVSGAVIVAIAAFSFLRVYAVHGISFSYLPGSVSEGLAEGGIMDASLNGPLRHQMVDLNPLLHLFLMPSAVGLAAFVVVGLLAIAALARLFKLGLPEHRLLAASGVSLLLLMPIYHRYYDAVLLLPLIVLVINRLLARPRDKTLWIVALSITPLLFPIPSLLVRLAKRGTIPEALADQFAWKHLVLQHQSWCLLIAAVALVCWTWMLPTDGRADIGAEPASPSEGPASTDD